MGARRTAAATLGLAAGLLLLLAVANLEGASAGKYSPSDPLNRLTFGSCNDQKRRDEQSIWHAILAGRPDVWLWLGDNIYADTKINSFPKEFKSATIDQMRAMYDKQRSVPEYVELRKSVGKIVGTWDDHDYGLDDSGKELPWKRESQELLMNFLDVPKDSPLRSREGVYNSHVFGPEGKRVKLIILDTRYHRDPIFSDGDMLGEAQWRWLEHELVSSDAQFNLIASSIQYVPNHHVTLCPLCDIEQSPFRVETWSHYPTEKKRLGRIISENEVEGVMILSGDVHFGEILVSDPTCIAPYRLYELTSSGMTHSAADSFPALPLQIMKMVSPNLFSLGMYLSKNFGTVDFDWEGEAPSATLAVRDHSGHVVLRKRVSLDELKMGSRDSEGIPASCGDEASLHWAVRCRFCIVLGTLFLLTVFLVHYVISSLLALLRYRFVRKGEIKKKK